MGGGGPGHFKIEKHVVPLFIMLSTQQYLLVELGQYTLVVLHGLNLISIQISYEFSVCMSQP